MEESAFLSRVYILGLAWKTVLSLHILSKLLVPHGSSVLTVAAWVRVDGVVRGY